MVISFTVISLAVNSKEVGSLNTVTSFMEEEEFHLQMLTSLAVSNTDAVIISKVINN